MTANNKTRISTGLAIAAVMLALLGFWLMGLNGKPLTKYELTPHGILHLELPLNGSDDVHQILQTWGNDGIEVAWLNCIWDFLFMLVYTLAFIASLRWFAQHRSGFGGRAAQWLLGIAWWPAALDVLENAGMMYWLKTREVPQWSAHVVFAASSFKWLLVAIFIAYALIALFLPNNNRTQ